MRIIAGSAKRREIRVPKALVRPTTDRTREAVFSMITHFLSNARVLDLFAGAGSLGMEALSRGAASCDFIELNKSCARVIEENLQNLKLDGGRVIVSDAIQYKSRASTQYDLIFADPPYWKQIGDRDFAAELLEGMTDLLSSKGLLIIEVSDLYSVEVPANLKIVDERTYGSCKVIYIQKNENG